MIYLYVKESPLGLKYLGKTIRDPFKYKGSGKKWKAHLKYHNFTCKNLKTTVIYQSKNLNDIIIMGIFFSTWFNVVKSKDWANLIPEAGEGIHGWKHSEATKQKMSLSSKGLVLTKEQLEKMKEGSRKKGWKHKEKPIVQYDLQNNFIQSHDSILAASQKSGVSRTSIINNLRKRSKMAGKYIWKYK